jgi:hypothetical protein
MTTTYDVRIWATDKYQGKTTTYYVRWRVAERRWKEPFKPSALAESFRSDLLAAARNGEAFVVETGRPVSMQRTENDMSFYEFACSCVDMKWPGSAGNSRKGVAETLTTVMPALLATRRGKPDDKVIRQALNGWAFNKKRRETVPPPAEVKEALRWLQNNTRPRSTLAEAANMRAVLDRLAQKLDGSQAAAATVRRKRAVLFNAMEYAVELRLLPKNPILALKWKGPKPPKAIDKRVVVNPQQVARLLDAVCSQTPSGPRLVAFFAVMHYSAARPAEAVNIRKQDLSLPEEGWGELLL